MSLQDYQRLDEAYHNMYTRRTPMEDCEDREDESTPAEDKTKKMEYLKSKGMKTWPDENAEEELGVDPKEADELEDVMKKHGGEKSFFKNEPRQEPDFQKTDVWKAYKTIQAGQWSEDDFLQWARSLWAAGAEESRRG